jgi:hypothetical protein
MHAKSRKPARTDPTQCGVPVQICAPQNGCDTGRRPCSLSKPQYSTRTCKRAPTLPDSAARASEELQKSQSTHSVAATRCPAPSSKKLTRLYWQRCYVTRISLSKEGHRQTPHIITRALTKIRSPGNNPGNTPGNLRLLHSRTYAIRKRWQSGILRREEVSERV